MYPVNHKRAVVALISGKSGLILGVSRKNNHLDFGLPGGAVEIDETNEEAIMREVKEETNVDFANPIPVFTHPCGKYIVTTYTGDAAGIPMQMEDGYVAWIKPYLLAKGSFAHYNVELFKSLANKSFQNK